MPGLQQGAAEMIDSAPDNFKEDPEYNVGNFVDNPRGNQTRAAWNPKPAVRKLPTRRQAARPRRSLTLFSFIFNCAAQDR